MMFFSSFLLVAACSSPVRSEKSLPFLVIIIALVEPKSFISTKASFLLEPDIYGYYLSLTAIMIMMVTLMTLRSEGEASKKKILYSLISMLNLTIFLMIFTSNQYVFFFLYELSAVPMFLVIGGWGKQPERIGAAYSLLFYTMLNSCPLLLCLLLMQMEGVTEFSYLENSSLESVVDMSQAYAMPFMFTVMILTAFLVKFPIFGVHMWLPKAHVEAPVYGSMMLAGILLKLAGVGLLRFNSPEMSEKVIKFMVVLAVIGGAVASLWGLSMGDMKSVIAMSSVVHMSLVIVSILVSTETSLYCALLLMVTHSFSSTTMFYLSYTMYLHSNSRSIYMNSSLIAVDVVLSYSWLSTIFSSLGTPPTGNWISETMLFNLIMLSCPIFLVTMCVVTLMNSFYSSLLIIQTQQGLGNEESMERISSLSPVNKVTIYCLVFLIFVPNFFYLSL